jgi:hypothetical protein
MVLEHSFLFPTACTTVLAQNKNVGRGRQRGPKSSGNRNMEESKPIYFLHRIGGELVQFFPMPPIPIVLKLSFLFRCFFTHCLNKEIMHLIDLELSLEGEEQRT